MTDSNMNDPRLQSALQRAGRWGRANAQLMAVIIPTSAAVIGIASYVGSTITALQKDLEKEQDLRQKDIELANNNIEKERELRKSEVDRSFEAGKAYNLERTFNETHYITQLAFGEEYKNSPEAQKAKRT